MRPAEYRCLNKHLGKAGGLNFGMHAIDMLMAEQRLPPLGMTNAMLFGICDARHAVDQRFWLHVMPQFFFANEHSEVTFQHDVCLVQLAHHYLGMKHANDFLDMRNDFLFTGMAVIRNQSYGMTSCGTGGIWSITNPDLDLEDYFFGRTMIEDTASSIEQFLDGYKALYVAPFANKESHAQLMCAVPKVSANYLEALERWDTGAIQCLCSLALSKPWFWLAQAIALAVGFVICWPAWVSLGRIALVESWADFVALFSGAWYENEGLLAILVALAAWGTIYLLFFATARCCPRTLNFAMRMCILYFNVTYPLNAIASVFWIAIPPWICIGGAPLPLQPRLRHPRLARPTPHRVGDRAAGQEGGEPGGVAPARVLHLPRAADERGDRADQAARRHPRLPRRVERRLRQA